MAAAVIPPPPPGFKLDAVPPPPPGFTLDSPAAPAEVPKAGLADRVPLPGGGSYDAQGHEYPAPPAAPETPEPSIWEKFKSTISNDPVAQMIGHGVSTIAQGAPETALDIVNNAGTMATAGIAGSFIPDANDSANFMNDFKAKYIRQASGENAKALEAGLGEAFSPYEEGKRALGDTTLEATGSPGLAATADFLPDLGMALIGGGPGASATEKGTAALAPKAPEVVNPAVTNLRAADIRLRPSDVRAVTPNKKIKVPGETRERFADGPDLKKDLTLHNQQKLTDVAAKELEVKDLTPASRAEAEKGPIKAYETAEEIAHQGVWTPENADVLREALDSVKLERPRGEAPTVTGTIGALRRRASKRINSGNVESEQAGYADRNMAEALEEALGKELEARGEPQVLADYQAGREKFAKIHDVFDSVRADHIDAAALKRLNDKYGGNRLTGGLKLIADASEYAPNVTKHSTTTAAREGAEVPTTFTGAATDFTKRLIRKIPGMDVSAPSVQNKFGMPDEARTSYYGRDNSVAPPRGPEQSNLDLREALDLEAPPGEVGAPVRQPRELGPQIDALGNAFEFDMAPGSVGIPPEAPISLQDLLGLGEPLNLKPTPGRVGKPKRKS